MTTFGVRLRKLRLERGLSINILSEAIGFRRETVSKWERGKSSPKSIDTIAAVAEFFRVPTEFFFNDQEWAAFRKEVRLLREEVNDLRQHLKNE